MAFMLSFSSKAVKKAFGEWLARQGPLASLNSEGASSVMGKASRFADGPVHDHRCRVVSSRKGAGTGAAPVGEAVTRGRLGTNGDRRASGFPAAVRRHRAASPRVHREVVLGAEFRGVSRTLCRRDRMGDRPAVTPTAEIVAH